MAEPITAIPAGLIAKHMRATFAELGDDPSLLSNFVAGCNEEMTHNDRPRAFAVLGALGAMTIMKVTARAMTEAASECVLPKEVYARADLAVGCADTVAHYARFGGRLGALYQSRTDLEIPPEINPDIFLRKLSNDIKLEPFKEVYKPPLVEVAMLAGGALRLASGEVLDPAEAVRRSEGLTQFARTTKDARTELYTYIGFPYAKQTLLRLNGVGDAATVSFTGDAIATIRSQFSRVGSGCPMANVADFDSPAYGDQAAPSALQWAWRAFATLYVQGDATAMEANFPDNAVRELMPE